MTDEPSTTRRRLLELSAGALGVTALTGCTGPGGGGGGGGGDGGGADEGGDGGDQPAPRGEETPGVATTEDQQTPADDTVTEAAETEATNGSGNGSNNGSGNGSNTGTGTGTAGGGQNQIRLGARTDGWVGQAPDSIADQQNPDLSLVAGETYELTWVNLDGNEHQLLIEDQNQTVLYTTDRMSGQGSEQTITFEAREAMSTYYCNVHPSQMRGQVLMEGESVGNTPSG